MTVSPGGTRSPGPGSLLTTWPFGAPAGFPIPAGAFGRTIGVLAAIGGVLPMVGSGDSLARATSELEAPRIRGVRRTLAILTGYAGFVTVTSACLYVWIVPAESHRVWNEVPLLGILANTGVPFGLRAFVTLALMASAALLLGQALLLQAAPVERHPVAPGGEALLGARGRGHQGGPVVERLPP